MKQPGFFDLSDHLQRLSTKGDPLETMAAVVDFEMFRPTLNKALAYTSGSAKGGRPPYDCVAMFKALILAAQNNVSDERMEFLIRDRMSWMRFLGFDFGRPTPDENTIRAFRERLTEAGAIKTLFAEFDRLLRASGYLAQGGQILDATLVAAPRQRNTNEEKARIKAGETANEIWAHEPAKAAQKDTHARWTIKQGKAKPAPNEASSPIQIAIPVFGYKNHIGVDRHFGFIRRFEVTDAARYDGAQLPNLIDPNNTASDVWADTAYRSTANETWLKDHGKTSRVHARKPKGKPMSERTRRANAKKSEVRSRVEHPFAILKGPMGLFVRTIGLARAKAKIGLANLAYNMGRLVFHERPRLQEKCA